MERALDARGECGQRASIWVTEAGAGAPHPGARGPPARRDEHEGCVALAQQLHGWVADARVEAIFQYSFREDPAFPVALVSADLSTSIRPTGSGCFYARAARAGPAPPSQTALCA